MQDSLRKSNSGSFNTPNNRLLSTREVLHITGWSRSTLYRKIRDGLFPTPVDLGNGSRGWCSNDVEEWLENLRRVSYKQTITNFDGDQCNETEAE